MSSRLETLNEDLNIVFNKLNQQTDSYRFNEILVYNAISEGNTLIGASIALCDFILEASATYLLHMNSTLFRISSGLNYVTEGFWRINTDGVGGMGINIWSYNNNGTTPPTTPDFVLSSPAPFVVRISTSAITLNDYYLSVRLHGCKGAEYIKKYYKNS